MSKNVHPYSHRLVVLRDWKSRWFSVPKKMQAILRGDVLMREYLEKQLKGSFVSEIEIERSRKDARIIINTSRPGMIIGRSGEGAQKLRKGLVKFMKKNQISVPEDFKIDIVEVKNPDANASLVAQQIGEALNKRMPFRRVLKQTIEKIMAERGVKGAKIQVSGRLGGAEMARREEIKRGGIPLQFLRGDIDYHHHNAVLPYGVIGVKVWIYKGDALENTK